MVRAGRSLEPYNASLSFSLSSRPFASSSFRRERSSSWFEFAPGGGRLVMQTLSGLPKGWTKRPLFTPRSNLAVGFADASWRLRAIWRLIWTVWAGALRKSFIGGVSWGACSCPSIVLAFLSISMTCLDVEFFSANCAVWLFVICSMQLATLRSVDSRSGPLEAGEGADSGAEVAVVSLVLKMFLAVEESSAEVSRGNCAGLLVERSGVTLLRWLRRRLAFASFCQLWTCGSKFSLNAASRLLEASQALTDWMTDRLSRIGWLSQEPSWTPSSRLACCCCQRIFALESSSCETSSTNCLMAEIDRLGLVSRMVLAREGDRMTLLEICFSSTSSAMASDAGSDVARIESSVGTMIVFVLKRREGRTWTAMAESPCPRRAW